MRLAQGGCSGCPDNYPYALRVCLLQLGKHNRVACVMVCSYCMRVHKMKLAFFKQKYMETRHTEQYMHVNDGTPNQSTHYKTRQTLII